MPEPAPGPGWYADPSGVHAWRWWSGEAWTTHTASVPGFLSPTARAAELESEMRLARLAIWAPTVWVIASLVGLIAEWQLGGVLARDLHWFSHAIDQSRTTHGATAFSSPPPPPLAAIAWLWLQVPFALASEVVLVMWQYRAAKVALSLEYPGQVTPGWGVAAWFIPVLQLWMPYLAVRSLLPAGHRERRTLPYWWASLVASSVLAGALPVLVAFARPVAIADVSVLVLLEVTVGVLARLIVVAVVADHRTAAAAWSSAGGTPS